MTVPPKLTAPQTSALEDLVRHRGRIRVARLLGTTPTTVDAILIGRAKAPTVARIAAKLDEVDAEQRRAVSFTYMAKEDDGGSVRCLVLQAEGDPESVAAAVGAALAIAKAVR